MPTAPAYKVLIMLRATRINLLDAKIRNGEFKRLLYKSPLGHNMVSTVIAMGAQIVVPQAPTLT
jgi:NADPH:quinone reductase-like Zn-dependent oxidoreductase